MEVWLDEEGGHRWGIGNGKGKLDHKSRPRQGGLNEGHMMGLREVEGQCYHIRKHRIWAIPHMEKTKEGLARQGLHHEA